MHVRECGYVNCCFYYYYHLCYIVSLPTMARTQNARQTANKCPKRISHSFLYSHTTVSSVALRKRNNNNNNDNNNNILINVTELNAATCCAPIVYFYATALFSRGIFSIYFSGIACNANNCMCVLRSTSRHYICEHEWTENGILWLWQTHKWHLNNAIFWWNSCSTHSLPLWVLRCQVLGHGYSDVFTPYASTLFSAKCEARYKIIGMAI